MTIEQTLIKAFPGSCEKDIRSMLNKVAIIAEHETTKSFPISFQSELLEIPFRIYFREVDKAYLNKNDTLLLNCVFTRHHNGFVRQNDLEQIITHEKPFIAPFVFQLLGEPIIQIIDVINDNLTDNLIKNMSSLARKNPNYLQLTKERMTSYWNCYYRYKFNDKSDNTGFQILEKLDL